MTTIPDLPSLDLTKYKEMKIMKTAPNLLPFEQKNMAILMTARHKLAIYTRKVKDDIFANTLLAWLEENVMDYKDLEILFLTYSNTRIGTFMSNSLFKILKPLEEIAVYLSEVAEVDMEVDWVKNEEYVVPFVLNLLTYWFNILNKHTNHFRGALEYDYQYKLDEITAKFIKKDKNLFKDKDAIIADEKRAHLHNIFDKAVDVCETVSSYTFKTTVRLKTNRPTTSKKTPKRKKK